MLLNQKKRLLLLRERVLVPKRKDYLRTFDLFRINTKKLKSGYYFLDYTLSGKVFYEKRVRFDDFTYDFRRNII